MAGAVRRSYTPEDRAAALAALAANGHNFRRTSAETGVPRPTLHLWAGQAARAASGTLSEVSVTPKPLPATAPDPALVSVATADLAGRIEAIAHAACDALPGKLPSMAGEKLAVVLGIAVDKLQLLRGRPTGIQQNVHLVAAIDARARAYDAAAAAERALLAEGAAGPDGDGEPVHPPPADAAAG